MAISAIKATKTTHLALHLGVTRNSFLEGDCKTKKESLDSLSEIIDNISQELNAQKQLSITEIKELFKDFSKQFVIEEKSTEEDLLADNTFLMIENAVLKRAFTHAPELSEPVFNANLFKVDIKEETKEGNSKAVYKMYFHAIDTTLITEYIIKNPISMKVKGVNGIGEFELDTNIQTDSIEGTAIIYHNNDTIYHPFNKAIQ